MLEDTNASWSASRRAVPLILGGDDPPETFMSRAWMCRAWKRSRWRTLGDGVGRGPGAPADHVTPSVEVGRVYGWAFHRFPSRHPSTPLEAVRGATACCVRWASSAAATVPLTRALESLYATLGTPEAVAQHIVRTDHRGRPHPRQRRGADPDLILTGTGSEVHVCVEAAALLDPGPAVGTTGVRGTSPRPDTRSTSGGQLLGGMEYVTEARATGAASPSE